MCIYTCNYLYVYIYESETLMLMNLCVKARGPRKVTKSKLTSRAPGPGPRAPGRRPQATDPRPRALGPVPRAQGPGPRAPGTAPWAPGGLGAPSPEATTTNFVTLLNWIPTLIYIYIYICIQTSAYIQI